MTQGAYQPPPDDLAGRAHGAQPPAAGSGRAVLDLAHALSHDLRGPLTLVTGVLQTLARSEDAPSDPAVRSLLDSAFEGARRMRMMLDDFLAAADLVSGEARLRPRSVDPTDVLQRAVTQDERLVRVATVRGSDLPRVVLDPAHFAMAVTGLARAELDRGSERITIDVAVGTGRLVVVVVGDAPVSVSGPGVSRLDSSGWGLAEHLAAALVETMDGNLATVSIPGGGAGYRIVLPRADSADAEVLRPS